MVSANEMKFTLPAHWEVKAPVLAFALNEKVLAASCYCFQSLDDSQSELDYQELARHV